MPAFVISLGLIAYTLYGLRHEALKSWKGWAPQLVGVCVSAMGIAWIERQGEPAPLGWALVTAFSLVIAALVISMFKAIAEAPQATNQERLLPLERREHANPNHGQANSLSDATDPAEPCPSIRVADSPAVLALFEGPDSVRLFPLLEDERLLAWARPMGPGMPPPVRVPGATWRTHRMHFLERRGDKEINQTFIRTNQRQETSYYDLHLSRAQLKKFWPSLGELGQLTQTVIPSGGQLAPVTLHATAVVHGGKLRLDAGPNESQRFVKLRAEAGVSVDALLITIVNDHFHDTVDDIRVKIVSFADSRTKRPIATPLNCELETASRAVQPSLHPRERREYVLAIRETDNTNPATPIERLWLGDKTDGQQLTYGTYELRVACSGRDHSEKVEVIELRYSRTSIGLSGVRNEPQ